MPEKSIAHFALFYFLFKKALGEESGNSNIRFPVVLLLAEIRNQHLL